MPTTCKAGAAALLTAAALLCGLPPAPLAQPAPAATPVALSAAGQRDIYMMKSEEELDEWQARLLRFCEEAKLQARADTGAIRNELLTALEKAEARASRLQTAGAERWDDARIAYEQATSELAVTWDKVQAGDHR
jgi:hypothetical protein